MRNTNVGGFIIILSWYKIIYIEMYCKCVNITQYYYVCTSYIYRKNEYIYSSTKYIIIWHVSYQKYLSNCVMLGQ